MPDVEPQDLYLLLVSAGRYAWNRSSYIVDATAELIKKHSKNLTADQQKVILDDLEKAISNWEARAPGRWMECDKKSMKDLQKFLGR